MILNSAKELFAAAIILQLKYSKKSSDKWDNRKTWSMTWIYGNTESFLGQLL